MADLADRAQQSIEDENRLALVAHYAHRAEQREDGIEWAEGSVGEVGTDWRQWDNPRLKDRTRVGMETLASVEEYSRCPQCYLPLRRHLKSGYEFGDWSDGGDWHDVGPFCSSLCARIYGDSTT